MTDDWEPGIGSAQIKADSDAQAARIPMTDLDYESEWYRKGWEAGAEARPSEGLDTALDELRDLAGEIDAEGREWNSGTIEGWAVQLLALAARLSAGGATKP